MPSEFESYVTSGMRGPRIATSTCAHCHSIRPQTEMKQISIKENAGNSCRITPRSNGKISYSTSVYTRNKKVWLCNECVGAFKSERFFSSGWLKFVVIVGALWYYIAYVYVPVK